MSVPLVFTPERFNQHDRQLNLIGRLKPGISIQQAQANIDAVAARITPSLPNGSKDWRVSVEPLQAASLPNDRKFGSGSCWVWFASVLLMECVNVASLFRLRADAGYQLHLSPGFRFPPD